MYGWGCCALRWRCLLSGVVGDLFVFVDGLEKVVLVVQDHLGFDGLGGAAEVGELLAADGDEIGVQRPAGVDEGGVGALELAYEAGGLAAFRCLMAGFGGEGESAHGGFSAPTEDILGMKPILKRVSAYGLKGRYKVNEVEHRRALAVHSNLRREELNDGFVVGDEVECAFLGSAPACHVRVQGAIPIQAMVVDGTLTDLSELRDTYVNGVWHAVVELRDGDVISFGCAPHARVTYVRSN